MTSSPVGKGTYRVQNILLCQWIKGTVALDENGLWNCTVYQNWHCLPRVVSYRCVWISSLILEGLISSSQARIIPAVLVNTVYGARPPAFEIRFAEKPHHLLAGANPMEISYMRISKDNQPWGDPGNDRKIQCSDKNMANNSHSYCCLRQGTILKMPIYWEENQRK